MPLSTESITDAALHILSQFGMGDLSMRRLARDLDVQPSALYWHVGSKQEVFVLVSRRIAGAVDDDLPRSSAPGPAAVAERLRRELLRFRDGAEIFLLAYALDPESAIPERLDEALPQRGAQEVLLSFVLGFVQVEQSRAELGIESIGADERFSRGMKALLVPQSD